MAWGEVDINRLNAIEGEGEEDEGREEEEDNVNERNDLNACLLGVLLSEPLGLIATGHV